jgi:hypothetical protein
VGGAVALVLDRCGDLDGCQADAPLPTSGVQPMLLPGGMAR